MYSAAMKLLFDPIARWPNWSLWLLWLLPLLPLLFETDLTAILWLGSTALILLLSQSARLSVFQMVYKNWTITIIIGLVIGTFVGLVANPAMDTLAEYLTGTKIDLSQFSDVTGDTGAYIELLIIAMIFGGIVEEIAFRGFFIGWGVNLFGAVAAIPLVAISSIAFAIGHLYQNAAGGLSTGLFAVLLGALYLLFDRKLLPVILVHAVSNFWGVTEIYLNGV